MKFRFFLIFLAAGLPLGAVDILQLPIGDPDRKDHQVSLTIDAITDTATGEDLSVPELVDRLKDVRLLLLGESHTSFEVHRIQEQIIRALADSGRQVSVGLEMFPYTEQKSLNHWTQGYFTEEGFVTLAHWYRHWGYDWRYYRPIFLSARERKLPMFGLNTPRAIVTAVRTKGFEGLSEEERAQIPDQIDTNNQEHLRLFKAYFAGDDEEEEEEDEGGEEDDSHPQSFHNSLSEEQWQGMFNAQCTWDATMAYHAVQALEKSTGPDSILVVLVGAGHVAYGLGIERQAAQWFDGKVASLVPLPVDPNDERPNQVQASYANFLWGYPEETYPAYPSLGISTMPDNDSGHLKILFVQENSVAEHSGLKSGDQLVSVGGREVLEKSQLNRILAAMNWGDSVVVKIRRGEEVQDIRIHFRRSNSED